ncbi:CRISPR-associated ring nuclease Csm6 [Thiofilum flexile]|uniref:CRISPR-associated ring nuclease Csm6 n=1 Tax=Thiofilum flexile TaxID=125627 RepID=UPI00036A5B92|nr:CRISPR-associated ring nuclease Csm6 [Thiofilum flexile]
MLSSHPPLSAIPLATEAQQQVEHVWSRRILLAVAARSPQVVTETLYALMHETPSWQATEVHVITTGHGKIGVERLLDQAYGGEGWLSRLCHDYQLPLPAFTPEHIHLITDDDGYELDDIRTRSDNTHAADFISQVVRRLTAFPDTQLVISLSGGRRTMTFYIGYALSLFGRLQDRLTHVLVDDAYFFLPDFFYPPPYSQWLTGQDGKPFDAAQVEVILADIPFVRLREGLPQALLEGNSSFSASIKAAQHQLNNPMVVFKSVERELWCGGELVPMPPILIVFYVWMLQRCQQQRPPLHWRDQENPVLAEQFLQIYRDLFGSRGSYHTVAKGLQQGIGKNWFEERKSQINKTLKQALGLGKATPYLLYTYGQRPATRCGLHLQPEQIHWSEP